MKKCKNGHTTYDDDKFCTECGLPMEETPDKCATFTAYLRNSYEPGEWQEVYGVSERQGRVLRYLLSDVGIIVECDEEGCTIKGIDPTEIGSRLTYKEIE